MAARANRGARGINELRRDLMHRVARPGTWYSDEVEITQWKLRKVRKNDDRVPISFSIKEEVTACVRVLDPADGGWRRDARLEECRLN